MGLPQGYESSKQYSNDDVPSPYQLEPMVVPTLTPNLQFPPNKIEGLEIEFGDGKNWTSTFVYYKLPVLAKGEELAWHLLNTEGVFNKKASVLFAITNFRVLIYDFKNPDKSGNVFLSTVDDILVMNSHRVSHSTRMGSFGSTGRYGMRVGTGGSSGTSTSQTVGDVVFMKDGQRFIVMGAMADPHGIAKLAKTIKKNVRVRDSVSINNLPDVLQGSTLPKETLVELMRLYKNDQAEFVKQSKKILETNPDNALFHLLIIPIFDSQDWKEMESISRKMISLSNNEHAFETLCTALFKLYKTAEAIRELNASLKLFPNNTILQGYKKQVAPIESDILESEASSLETKSIICPKCKKDNKKGSKFCNSCGSNLNEGCVKCGYVNPKNAKFCNECGFTLR